MAISRYTLDNIINRGQQYGTAAATQIIRNGISNGAIRFETALLRGGERLDTVAGEVYGDSTLWWIIAAASNIGWAAQVPAGILLRIPNPNDIAEIFE